MVQEANLYWQDDFCGPLGEGKPWPDAVQKPVSEISEQHCENMYVKTTQEATLCNLD